MHPVPTGFPKAHCQRCRDRNWRELVTKLEGEYQELERALRVYCQTPESTQEAYVQRRLAELTRWNRW